MSKSTPIAYLEFVDDDALRVYADPVEVITTCDVAQVVDVLAQVEARVADGYHAAGYVAYEAASAFDTAFQTHAQQDIPLVWFGIYTGFSSESPIVRTDLAAMPTHQWRPTLDEAAYGQIFSKIQRHIAAGDSYQVNFTFPTMASMKVDGLNWFRDRQRAQRGAYSAYLNLGRHEITSLSPELFFSLDGDKLTSRPMKGTRPRGFNSRQDLELADELRHSPKEQAENLMIVDMLRNDMGRVCENSSIQVPRLFEIERYPTVWQMTSTVTGTTSATVPDIFQALFPCASVTGAPKIETMKIIRQLETAPRGVYCGAVGWWEPERRAQFNVAIRTATLDNEESLAQYSVGSGITWDSEANDEYAECKSKNAVLGHKTPEFELLTSIRLDKEGFAHLPFHLERLEASADHFGFAFERNAVEASLQSYRGYVTETPAKVRLCVDAASRASISHTTLPEPGPWKVGLAQTPINTGQPWVYHKTTCRTCYDTARNTRPDCTDVVLFSEEGLLTEATYANVVLRISGKLYTPSLTSGLLDGVYRRHLLDTGEILERDIRVEELELADEMHLINSVRGWIPVEWQPDPEGTLVELGAATID
jgi:para-aminobenzoate synthetase / 4-amino-4-deoxychorismate lyase